MQEASLPSKKCIKRILVVVAGNADFHPTREEVERNINIIEKNANSQEAAIIC